MSKAGWSSGWTTYQKFIQDLALVRCSEELR